MFYLPLYYSTCDFCSSDESVIYVNNLLINWFVQLSHKSAMNHLQSCLTMFFVSKLSKLISLGICPKSHFDDLRNAPIKPPIFDVGCYLSFALLYHSPARGNPIREFPSCNSFTYSFYRTCTYRLYWAVQRWTFFVHLQHNHHIYCCSLMITDHWTIEWGLK